MTTKSLGPSTIFLGLTAAWTIYWCIERMHVYSYASPETMVNATLASYMPFNAPEEWKGALGGALSKMYDKDREFFSRVIHVNMSGIMALCCVVNLYLGLDDHGVASLSKAERITSTKAMIHRITGQIFRTAFVPWALYLNYTLFIHGMIPFGPIIDNADKIASVVATTAFSAGIKYVTVGNIPAHRICMIIGTAGLFTIPVERMYWFLVMNGLGSVDNFNNNLGNYFKTLDGTVYASFLTCGLLARIYTKGSKVDWSMKKKKYA